MRWFLILLLSLSWASAQVFTEFYCDASVSANNTNVNAGSTTGAPVYGPSVNGNWDGTSVFTPTDGSTPASTVSAGMWASVYLDAATVAVYIAQVTNVAAGANGAITLSQAAFSGSKPASGATGRTIRVGGCWNGPFGAVGFPFGFIASTATNNTSYAPRVNFKNASTYSITAQMTHTIVGPVVFQGYTTSPGDGGQAIIQGPASGTSFILLSASTSSSFCTFANLTFSQNGNSGSAAGVWSGGGALWYRCAFYNMCRSGIIINYPQVIMMECEASTNNTLNASGKGGFEDGGNQASFIRCISHHNSTANAVGYVIGSGTLLLNSISAYNGNLGVKDDSLDRAVIYGCDVYSNSSDGLKFSASGLLNVNIQNCNFVANAGYGINSAASPIYSGTIANCGFGTGTATNSLGSISSAINNNAAVLKFGSVNYSSGSTPWSNPGAMNFNITLSSAKAAGRGSFLVGTTGYPDIGSAQSASTNASGESWTFSQ